MDTILRLEGVTRRFDSFTLQPLHLEWPGGVIMGLIGENGAGKTTTLRLILGALHRDGGKITIFGNPLDGNEANIRQDIGVVFDECCFHESMTPKNIDSIFKGIYQNWNSSDFQRYCTFLQLPMKKKIKDFSRGMRMKLSIAAAMSHRPKLLLLDEATSGLDPVVRDDVLELLQEFVSDEEHSVLFSSHITEDLEKIADYVAYLHGGNLQFVRSKDELLYEYGILKCGKSEFEKMDKSDFAAWRENAFEVQALTENREEAHRKYPSCVIDQAGLEEIMLLYSKGKVQRGERT